MKINSAGLEKAQRKIYLLMNIKLFKLGIPGIQKSYALDYAALEKEKVIQAICEQNLELFFGIKYLDSEYPKEMEHGIRIDTIGIDAGGPVIIEHKPAFKLLVYEKLGRETKISWKNCRILCMAEEFDKNDLSIRKISQTRIDLVCYKVFEESVLAFEYLTDTKSNGLNNDHKPDLKQKFKTNLPPVHPKIPSDINKFLRDAWYIKTRGAQAQMIFANPILHQNRRGFWAIKGGCTLIQNSTIAKNVTSSFLNSFRAKRKLILAQHKHIVRHEDILIAENIDFDNANQLISFVGGRHSNAWAILETADGKTLGQIIKE